MPGPVTFSAGWHRARARPWNEIVTEPIVRLDRGGAEFLGSVGDALAAMGAKEAYSPALYQPSTRVWRRSGFEDHADLEVMERSLETLYRTPADQHVGIDPEPDWEAIVAIDRTAFDGFWGMSTLALQEAHAANRSTTVLTVTDGNEMIGYAIVGSQWGVAYLHRIAVRRDREGAGLGAALLGAAMDWGRSAGGRSIVLNVRADNERARRLYRKMGFTDTGSRLVVLRRDLVC